MPRIGLIHQGRYHQIVIESLVRKVLGASFELVPRLGDSWPGILGNLVGLLQALHVDHLGVPLEKVLVVVDADKQDPFEREERLRKKVGNHTFGFGTVHYHAILREIETWIIGDPHAVNTAAGRNIPAVAEPETLLGPKRHLIEQLRNSRVDYDPGFVRRAAEAIEVDRLESKCRRFREFRKQLEDC